MARYVVTAPVTIPGQLGPYGYPAQVLKKGDVIEATASQISAWGVSTKAVSTTAGTGAAGDRYTLGEAVGVSNASA